MVKRWKESCTLLVGEGGARVLEPFLRMVIWGGIPSTISCGLKLKNGVGDVLALGNIQKRREMMGMGMGNLGGYVEGVGYRARRNVYHQHF